MEGSERSYSGGGGGGGARVHHLPPRRGNSLAGRFLFGVLDFADFARWIFFRRGFVGSSRRRESFVLAGSRFAVGFGERWLGFYCDGTFPCYWVLFEVLTFLFWVVMS